MNIIENIYKNPVVLYGVAGLFAGNLLGGSQKERTSQAVLYGALGAGCRMVRHERKRTKAASADKQSHRH